MDAAEATADGRLAVGAHGYLPGADIGSKPITLAYTPVARTNPFQGLLYSRALKFGVAPLPVPEWRRITDIPWRESLVWHIHWVADVCGRAASEVEAMDRIGQFEEVIDEVRRGGGRVVWTVHNVLPHDSRFPDADIALRRLLAARTDAIHVMSQDAPSRMESVSPLPSEKTFLVPHPSYAGVYPDYVGRREARLELGVAQESLAILQFGALAPYKGLDDLVAAFEAIESRPEQPPLHLLIAGQCADAGLAAELGAWEAERDNATVLLSRVPEADVQYFFRSADVVVLPYRAGLNSGVALLALTFGAPVLASWRLAIGDLGPDHAGVLCYDATDPDGLKSALHSLRAADLATERRRIASVAPMFAPPRVSEAFFRAMFGVLGWPRAELPDDA